MKKMIVVFLIFMAILVGLIVYGKTIDAGKENLRAEARPAYRFTLVVPLVGNRYWSHVEESVRETGKKYNADIKCVGSSHLDKNEQIEFISAAIASRVDGIITSSCESDAFDGTIAEAKRLGIPVILVDNDSPSSGRNMYIGTDNVAAGRKAAEAMIRATGGKATIGILVGSASAKNQIARVSGFRSGIVAFPGMNVVAVIEGKSDLPMINERVNNLFDVHPEISALLCTEGFGPVGAGEAIRSRGLKGKIVAIGFDNLSETMAYVSDGTFYATMVQQPELMGSLAVEKLVEYCSGHRFNGVIINTSVEIVSHVDK